MGRVAMCEHTLAGNDTEFSFTVGIPTAVFGGNTSTLWYRSDWRRRRTAPRFSEDKREHYQLHDPLSPTVAAGEYLRCRLLRSLGRLETSTLLGCVGRLHCSYHLLRPVD